MRIVLAALLSAVALVTASPLTSRTFDPNSYKLKTTKCVAVDHATGGSSSISIEYLSINPTANRTILFVHGWPSIWTIWGPQVVEFSDYHLIVPNLRGFGKSGFAGSVENTGTFFDIANDLNCLLEAEKSPQAACVGIDWGTQVCLEMAIFYPNKILGASGTIPYQPNNGDYVPVWEFTGTIPQLGYQVYFNNYTAEAIAELNTDIRRSLRATYKTGTDPLPDNYLISQTDYLGCWCKDTTYLIR